MNSTMHSVICIQNIHIHGEKKRCHKSMSTNLYFGLHIYDSVHAVQMIFLMLYLKSIQQVAAICLHLLSVTAWVHTLLLQSLPTVHCSCHFYNTFFHNPIWSSLLLSWRCVSSLVCWVATIEGQIGAMGDNERQGFSQICYIRSPSNPACMLFARD